MSDFKNRSVQLEMMDQPVLDKNELFVNLKELITINRFTGGPDLTFSQLKKMLQDITHEVHIVDIGFGAGDMLNHLVNHAHELKCPIRITAVDLMPEAHEFTHKKYPHLNGKVQFELCSYQDWFQRGNQADVILTGLFCHHLNNLQLHEFLIEANNNSRIGFIMNDLHRHPLAYHFIRIVTKLFSSSVFTKNDAPLSVLRSFRKNEWMKFCQNAGLKNYTIQWKWAFRFLVNVQHEYDK